MAITRPVATMLEAAPHIGGARHKADEWIDLIEPYEGTTIGRAARSRTATINAAVEAAQAAQAEMRDMPLHARAELLRRVADLVEARHVEIAERVSLQMGKTLKNTKREVGRSSWTFRAAATAAESLGGEVLPATAGPDAEGLLSLAIREPVGVVAAITPFNSPFNLVAHKVAPALAAGNAVVIKPASPAPYSALDLVDLLEEAGVPAGAVNVIPGDRSTALELAGHADVDLVTFTGGREAGEALRRIAYLRKVLLELGGNSPNIIHEDADVEAAAKSCAAGGFVNTGQSCNSVQRVIVHEAVADDVVAVLTAEAQRLRLGDPLDEQTDVGTLVNRNSAMRIESWLNEAVEAGATLQAGGTVKGAALAPTVVINAPTSARIVCEEVFGPVVVVVRYRDLDEAVRIANSTPYGLQAAIFTASLETALTATSGIRAGAVHVNRSSNFRRDHLPFGGVRESGIGREGPRYAVEEMTSVKHVLLAPTAGI